MQRGFANGLKLDLKCNAINYFDDKTTLFQCRASITNTVPTLSQHCQLKYSSRLRVLSVKHANAIAGQHGSEHYQKHYFIITKTQQREVDISTSPLRCCVLGMVCFTFYVKHKSNWANVGWKQRRRRLANIEPASAQCLLLYCFQTATLIRCLYNVGPASQTMAQHCTNNGSISVVA